MNTEMIITTSDIVDNFFVEEYLGVVFTSKVIASGIIGDVAAKITDFIGGSAKRYENILNEGIESAMEDLSQAAQQAGADAVTGVRVSLATFSTAKGGFFVILCHGTAVRGHYR